MTIHFNIGEAKAQLSKLIAAALRGEEVIIDKDGVPQVVLKPVDPDKAKQELREKRLAWMGSGKGKFSEEALEYAAEPAYSDEEWEEIISKPIDPE